jgi:hypothetical protein
MELAESKPVGPMGLLWQMRSKECRQGLGVLVELTRALGKMRAEIAPATHTVIWIILGEPTVACCPRI